YAPGSVMPGYAAAKAAMVNMTVSLAQELAQSGITANTLSPGPVHTPTMELMMRGLAAQHGWGNDWDEIERRVASQAIPTLVGRVGRVEEIAAAVAFLASTHADYMTGSHLRMDGGNIKSIV
ncbi:MAG: SDR family oxidoreductase, partial [Polyangiales bacterium]